MFIKKIKLKASEKVRLESMLTKSPAKYPIRLSTVKPFFIDRYAIGFIVIVRQHLC